MTLLILARCVINNIYVDCLIDASNKINIFFKLGYDDDSDYNPYRMLFYNDSSRYQCSHVVICVWYKNNFNHHKETFIFNNGSMGNHCPNLLRNIVRDVFGVVYG